MANGLKAVYEKAKTDAAFAKELVFDPTAACRNAGISLNKTEIKLLGDAMAEVRKYFADKLLLLTQGAEVLGHNGCIGICAGG
ncbi:MAG: hypothetical protein FJ118_20440 [Deltaproteobacteria bacterium]|nr:hypothetical protein [Deltaproteobacteria bacterium]